MAKYRVYLEAGASLTVNVEVDDSLDEGEAREAAIDKAFAARGRGGTICANCSGWGEKWSLDLGEWDVARDHAGNDINPERES